MTINTDAAIFETGGQSPVISDAANASDPSFTVIGDATTLTQPDFVSLGDAVLTIHCQTAPSAGDQVHLYRQSLELVAGVGDQEFPSANFKHTWVGSFPLAAVSTKQLVELTDIPLVLKQNFAIEYDLTATNGTVTDATTVHITPKAYNGKP